MTLNGLTSRLWRHDYQSRKTKECFNEQWIPTWFIKLLCNCFGDSNNCTSFIYLTTCNIIVQWTMNGSRARYYVVPASKMYNFRMCLQKCVVCFVKMSGFYRDFRMCLRTKLARLCLFNDPCMATSNIGYAKMLCNTSLCFHVYPSIVSL